MKDIISRILSVFKKEKKNNFQINDIYSACNSASGGLSQYCKIESLNK